MGRRGRPPYPDILTPREWEVLALLRENLTNEAIAARLGVTHAAAKYHVSEILSKLGVASREEAAAWEPEAEPRPWWAAGAAWLRPVTLAKAALVGASLVVLAGMGVLVWGTVRTAGESQEFDLPDSYEQMLNEGSVVYLAPADLALWIADESLVETAEIRVVSSIPALEEEASGDTAAVIIDRDFSADVSAQWAAGLVDRGVVIVAARSNVFDIPGVVPFDVPGAPPDSTHDAFDVFDESRIFYTLFERESAGCGPGGGSGEGSAQDLLDRRPVEDFRFFLVMLARHHANAKCEPATTP